MVQSYVIVHLNGHACVCVFLPTYSGARLDNGYVVYVKVFFCACSTPPNGMLYVVMYCASRANRKRTDKDTPQKEPCVHLRSRSYWGLDGHIHYTHSPGHFRHARVTHIFRPLDFHCSGLLSTAGKNYVPYVVEPSFGVGRILYSVLEQAFNCREGDEQRIVLSLSPMIAPYQCVLVPLVNTQELMDMTSQVADNLSSAGVSIRQDTSSTAIGRKYARADSLGIPFAVTVDFDSLTENTVTLRERDSCRQVRLPVCSLFFTPSVEPSACFHATRCVDVPPSPIHTLYSVPGSICLLAVPGSHQCTCTMMGPPRVPSVCNLCLPPSCAGVRSGVLRPPTVPAPAHMAAGLGAVPRTGAVCLGEDWEVMMEVFFLAPRCGNPSPIVFLNFSTSVLVPSPIPSVPPSLPHVVGVEVPVPLFPELDSPPPPLAPVAPHHPLWE